MKKTEERNVRLCVQYGEGASVEALCKAFALKRQRVRQILIEGGVYKKVKGTSTRREFLGILVNDEVKCGLKEVADRRSRESKPGTKVSASEVANEILEKALAVKP